MQITIQEQLDRARQHLLGAPFQPPIREAYLLLGHVLGLNEAQLLAHNEDLLSLSAEQEFERLLTRRLRGEPVAYLLGRKEFYGYEFVVDPRVLIPRPETEHLIEVALSQTLPSEPQILDLGTGSGCLAITLALELPRAKITAVDLSLDALSVACLNVDRHGVCDRVHLVAADLSSSLNLQRFDLIVSNPPYIGPAEYETLSNEIRHFEPTLALIAPDSSISIYEDILQSCSNAEVSAPIALEIGLGQLTELKELAKSTGFQLVTIKQDLSGVPRTVVLQVVANPKSLSETA